MRIKMLLRLLCGLCFWGGFSSAYSADYVWRAQFDWYAATGASPGAACSAAIAKYVAATDNNVSLAGVTKESDTSFTCKWADLNGYSGPSYAFSAYRTGDSCPAGLEYNSETGECLPPPVDCSTAGPGIFSKTGSIINSDGKNYVVTQGGGTVCYGQCNHTLSQSASSCYSSGDGMGFCNYVGTPDGTTCTGSDAPLGRTGDPLNPPDTPDVPPSDPNDPGCPAGYGWSGTTCAKLPGDDGDTGGGDSGGGDTGGDTGGGDTGGGSGGGGDTGGGSGGDGDGDGDGGDGGDGDGGTGDGGGSGGGSGGDGDDGEDEEPTSSVGGESCDATLSCEGDAVQCALLRQQKALHCHQKEQDDFNEHKADITALVQGDKFQLDEGGAAIEVPSFINQGTRFLPSTCPAAESFSLRMGGGRTFEISYEPLCRAASDLSGLFVAVATVLAALYVGRSVGGQ